MKVMNDRYRGYVTITFCQADVTGTLPEKILIKRKLSSALNYSTIGEVAISATSDLDFTVRDYFAIPNKTYTYACVPVVDSVEGTPVTGDVAVTFVGILVRDSTNAFVCGLNPEITSKRNCPVQYVKPFNGRTPHAVSNGSANYDTGTCKGLFLPLDSAGKPTLPTPASWNAEWNKSFLDFLTNRQTKLLKKYDGSIWMIHVDDTPYEEIGNVGSISLFSFNWTEIGDVPVANTVVVV